MNGSVDQLLLVLVWPSCPPLPLIISPLKSIESIHITNFGRSVPSSRGFYLLYGKPPPPPCSPRWLLQEVGSFGLPLEQLLCMCMQRTCMFHPNTILIKKAHHTEDTQTSHSTNTDKTSRPTDCRRFRMPSIPPSSRIPIDTLFGSFMKPTAVGHRVAANKKPQKAQNKTTVLTQNYGSFPRTVRDMREKKKRPLGVCT